MSFVVADHHHDADEGVYRLVIGERIEREEVTGYDEDGEEIVEIVAEIVEITDVVFSDSDPKWKRYKSKETIAEAQRQIVANRLAELAEEAPPAPTAPTVDQMPGVGEALS
jgi:hypothetical protein